MQLLLQHIEALIFVSEQPITGDEILSCLKSAYGWELKKEQFYSLISELKEKYSSEEFSFELVEIAEGFQFLSKKEYHHAVSVLLQIKAKKRLSTAALETLAIIAYKQPLSKSEIEHIRGVNCDYSIQKLLEKELIVISGKGDGPGKPLLYATSKNFMDHFGLKSVKELPKLKDLHIADSEIGTPSDLMDNEVPVDLDPHASGLKATDNEVIEASEERGDVELEEGGEFIIEGTVEAEAGLGSNLEQDLIEGEKPTEEKEE